MSHRLESILENEYPALLDNTTQRLDAYIQSCNDSIEDLIALVQAMEIMLPTLYSDILRWLPSTQDIEDPRVYATSLQDTPIRQAILNRYYHPDMDDSNPPAKGNDDSRIKDSFKSLHDINKVKNVGPKHNDDEGHIYPIQGSGPC